MKYTQEEILNALQVIKNTCKEQSDCSMCPFCTNGCLISAESPEDWRLNTTQKEAWKAIVE